MPRLTVTPDDLKKNQILEIDWYDAEVASYSYEKSKDEKSFNNIFEFKITGPNPDHAGVKIKVWFNEKALGSREFVEFFKALSGKEVDRKAGFTMDDPAQTKGMKLQVHVKPDTFGGRENNKIDGYRPTPRG